VSNRYDFALLDEVAGKTGNLPPTILYTREKTSGDLYKNVGVQDAFSQLGCIADPAVFVRGAWTNIIAIHGKRPGRRAAPMLSNLHLGLSLIEDERVHLFLELVDDFGHV